MDRETQRLVDLVASLAAGVDKVGLEEAKRAAMRRKSQGYDDVMKGVRERYSGNQKGHIDAALIKRFPQTHESMPRTGLNYLAMIAAQDSGVYVLPPDRWLEGAAGEIDDAVPDAQTFADAIESSGLDVAMGEMEMRGTVSGTMVGKGMWIEDAEDPQGGRASWPLYWPDQVGIVMHPMATDYTTLAQAVLLIAETSSPDPSQVAYEVYSRKFDPALVAGTYGPWVRGVVTADGEEVVKTAPLVGRFPWFIAQTGIPSGSPWIDVDVDLIGVVDTINCDDAAMRLAMDYGASPILNYYGTAVDSTALTVGPNAVNKLGPQERFEAVRVDPQLEEMGAQADRTTKQLAITRSNSPSAYTVEQGPPLSGVSRLIANIPHERKLSRLAHAWVQVENRQVLPILLSLIREHATTTIADGLVARMMPQKAPGYEDDTAKQERVLALLDHSVIDAPDARVMLGLSADREEAEAYIAKTRAPAAIPGTLKGSPFASVRETTETDTTDNTP